jgi:hypothetical protein
LTEKRNEIDEIGNRISVLKEERNNGTQIDKYLSSQRFHHSMKKEDYLIREDNTFSQT